LILLDYWLHAYLAFFSKALAAIAEIAQRRTLEAAIGERALNRHDAFGVMPIRRRDIDRRPGSSFRRLYRGQSSWAASDKIGR
jgi:hypothetical protein